MSEHYSLLVEPFDGPTKLPSVAEAWALTRLRQAALEATQFIADEVIISCVKAALMSQAGRPTQRENVYIDGYDGKWWVHRREPRERFGPFDTHPEAARESGRLTW